MSLEIFLQQAGLDEFEGHSQKSSGVTELLKKLSSAKNIKQVMEIGFNAGHSAETFLENNPGIFLTSFDLGSHEYVLTGKKFIDFRFPFRHRLFLGDSTDTVPEFSESNPDVRFDLIFIDGGHKYEIAKADLENARKLAHQETIVVMDDTMRTKKWIRRFHQGPNKCWEEALKHGIVEELGSDDFSEFYGASWGKFMALG